MNSVPPIGPSARKPPPEGDGTPPPKKKRYWWRFSLASLIIVAVSAAATSSAILLYIDSIAEAIGTKENKHLSKEVEGVLAKVHGGEPETILIFGSDKRPEFGEEYGRSDTTILLRLDSEQNLISVMSIPRDLKTEIPGVGTEKFNGAYSAGGPKLAAQVVKEMTGLKINHIVNIDFLGFVRAVDAIGCVYTDVDRRYYHSNAGVPEGSEEEYSAIDIKPGYQKLCGKKALEYVRYRHTDTDIVRSARQQSFLSQARHQISPLDLVTDNTGLIDILSEYTTSDIHEGTELITLLDLLYELKGAEVNQVHFPAELGPSYVYSNETEIHHAVKEFLGEAGFDSHKFPEEKPEAKKKKGEGSKSKSGHKHKKKKKKHHTPPGGDELVPASEAGQEMGEKVARQVGGGFPVFYPTRLPPEAFYQEDNSYEHIVNPWVYHLRDKEKVRHGAYRMIGIYTPEYEPTYFGVQGIAGWEDPPILDDPTETKTVNGREYLIYTDSGQVKMVAWHRGEDTYWISNSLQQSLTNEQMMGIAESSHVIMPPRKTAKQGSKNE
ncbi:MAG TPA: LCP family protein [Solirubrobacterales bacterium]|jgi:LCP family protein required for cell wall assembly|nr:LCP family protein [Solirubrobacterales bacterium]